MSVGTSDPLIGRLIDGRYQVRSRIARGGMATVYLATDLRLERRVAVKIMHGHLADDSQFKRRFIQEARSAARLAHPNVVNVFDQGQDEDSAYLVMEYLSGITLRDLLHDYGALTPKQTLDITEAVLSGLAAAHRAGIVHRDLKPENVLLADDGRIKIGDFGLARAASANTATGAALLGTIAYLSPELVTRGVADARSDIYAVGIMVYEMLTGEQPYKGEQPMQIAYQHANEQVPAPSVKNGRVPAELDELVLWATARDPENRPTDAQELLSGLHDAEASLGTRPGSVRPGAQRTDRTAVLRTAVLPSATRVVEPRRAGADDAATEVIGRASAVTAPVGPVRPGRGRDRPAANPTAALATVARRRRRRGWVIALVILLVAGLGAGAGWWFALGPGAQIGVPSVANLDPAAARSALIRDGFAVASATQSAYSLDVAASKVVGTDPKQGTVVGKGARVVLVLSQGPQPIALPKLIGETESAALAQVKQNWTSKASRQVFNDAAKSTVVDALGADGSSLGGVAQYPQKQPITLVVSVGKVPTDLAGKSVDAATKELADATLTVTATPQKAYSDTVGQNAVIGIAEDPGTLSPNGSVTLVVSEGPPPVPVPSILGQTWTQAKAALQAAGLKWAFKTSSDQAVATSFPDFAKVNTANPSVGTPIPKGSTVTVTVAYSYTGG